jgi:hypothetical protein
MNIIISKTATNFLFSSLCIAFFFFQSTTLHAQEAGEEDKTFNCAYEIEQQRALKNDKNYKRQEESFQQEYIKAVSNGTINNFNNTVYTLPVVVHLIHGGEALGTGANLTEEYIREKLQESTDRFRHASGMTFTNPYSGIDTKIEFCLATTDPDGNYTKGILRYYRPDLNVGTYNQIGNFIEATHWDRSRYYNMYVMTDMTNAAGVSFLGITAYQGGSTFWSGLIAHETGHYLSLRHTFSGGCVNNNCLTDGDRVCDTPPKARSGFTGSGNNRCVTPGNECAADDDDLSTNNPYRPVANGGLGDVNDMLENYMDYTGSCWEAFTQGQSAKMRLAIQNYRMEVVNYANTACAVRSLPANEAGITAINLNQTDFCDNQFMPSVTVKNYGSANLTSVNIEVKDTNGYVINEAFTLNLAPDADSVLSFTTPFILSSNSTLIAKTINPNGSVDAYIHNDAIYTNGIYLGGTSCGVLNACSNFNASTANGPGNRTTVNISNNFLDLENGLQAYVCVKAEGDVSSSIERFDIIDEDNNIRGRTKNSIDCSQTTTKTCFYISQADYNNWRLDSTITFTFNPISTGINPQLCATNQICVELFLPQGNAAPTFNFAGHWQHEDRNTQSIPATIIREENNQLYVHTFEKCAPTYCDWGEQSISVATIQNNEFFLQWNKGDTVVYDTLKMMNATTLKRGMRTSYPNSSGLADEHQSFLMHKNDCVNHLDLHHIEGADMTYWSANSFTSNGEVESGQMITFKAGTSIKMESGFHAKSGSSFIAKIENCNMTTTVLPYAKERETVNELEKTINHPTSLTKAKVYPNPARTAITIEIDKTEQGFEAALFDIIGRKVNQWRFSTNQATINITAISRGIYFLKLDDSIPKRVVIE